MPAHGCTMAQFDRRARAQHSRRWSRGSSFVDAGFTERADRRTRRVASAATGPAAVSTRSSVARETWEQELLAAVLLRSTARSRRTRRRRGSGSSCTGPRTRYEVTRATSRLSASKRRRVAPDDDRFRRRGRRGAIRHSVHDVRADALRLHDAALAVPAGPRARRRAAPRRSRRSTARSAAPHASTPARAAACRSFKRCSRNGTRRFDPGGSASELHVLEVIRDAGLPEPVQQHPSASRRSTTYRPRLRVARATGLRRVLRPGRPLGRERGRVRQRASDGARRRWLAPTRLHRRDVRPRDRPTTSRTRSSTAPSDGAIERRRAPERHQSDGAVGDVGCAAWSEGRGRICSRRRSRSGSRRGRRSRRGCGRGRSTRSSASSTCSGTGKSLRVLIESDRLSSLVLWGPPGTGKTTIARLVAGVSEKAFETLSRGERGREGRARGRRARPGPARRARPGHDPLPRRGAPLLPRPAGRAAAVRRGGAARARRRDHREPVLLAHRSAALAQHAVPARAARRRRPRASSRTARSTDTERGLGDEADRRSTTTRSSISSTRAKATRAISSPCSRSRTRSRSSDDRTTITLDDAEAALALRSVQLRRRRALRHRLRVHQVDPRLRSRRRASTGSRGCSKRARTRASSRAGS